MYGYMPLYLDIRKAALGFFRPDKFFLSRIHIHLIIIPVREVTMRLSLTGLKIDISPIRIIVNFY